MIYWVYFTPTNQECFSMKNYDFDWQINEFMVYCRSTQLRERTMYSYEQTLRLFERWLCDELKIYSVDKVTKNMIRKYINDLQERGKYTFFVNDLSKVKDYNSGYPHTQTTAGTRILVTVS